MKRQGIFSIIISIALLAAFTACQEPLIEEEDGVSPLAVQAKFYPENNNKEVFLFFDNDVELTEPFEGTGFTLRANANPFVYEIVSMERVNNSNKNWVLTLKEAPSSSIIIHKIIYDGDFIKGKGRDLVVEEFELDIETIVSEVKVTNAVVNDYGFAVFMTINTNIQFSDYTPEDEWVLIGSSTGEFRINFLSANVGSLLFSVNPRPTAEDVLHLSYHPYEGGELTAVNGMKLTSFDDMAVKK